MNVELLSRIFLSWIWRILSLFLILAGLISLKDVWPIWEEWFAGLIGMWRGVVDPIFELLFGWVEGLLGIDFPRWTHDYLTIGLGFCLGPWLRNFVAEAFNRVLGLIVNVQWIRQHSLEEFGFRAGEFRLKFELPWPIIVLRLLVVLAGLLGTIVLLTAFWPLALVAITVLYLRVRNKNDRKLVMEPLMTFSVFGVFLLICYSLKWMGVPIGG